MIQKGFFKTVRETVLFIIAAITMGGVLVQLYFNNFYVTQKQLKEEVSERKAAIREFKQEVNMVTSDNKNDHTVILTAIHDLTRQVDKLTEYQRLTEGAKQTKTIPN